MKDSKQDTTSWCERMYTTNSQHTPQTDFTAWFLRMKPDDSAFCLRNKHFCMICKLIFYAWNAWYNFQKWNCTMLQADTREEHRHDLIHGGISCSNSIKRYIRALLWSENGTQRFSSGHSDITVMKYAEHWNNSCRCFSFLLD